MDKKNFSAIEVRLNSAISYVIGRLGLNLQGAKVLDVKGRKSGEIRSVPVNSLVVGERRFIVSVRGESAWVRNLRAAGEATLRRGRNTESIRVHEIGDQGKVPILRAYLQKWAWQVKSIMEVGKDATDEDQRSIAAKHPIFEIAS